MVWCIIIHYLRFNLTFYMIDQNFIKIGYRVYRFLVFIYYRFREIIFKMTFFFVIPIDDVFLFIDWHLFFDIDLVLPLPLPILYFLCMMPTLKDKLGHIPTFFLWISSFKSKSKVTLNVQFIVLDELLIVLIMSYQLLGNEDDKKSYCTSSFDLRSINTIIEWNSFTRSVTNMPCFIMILTNCYIKTTLFEVEKFFMCVYTHTRRKMKNTNFYVLVSND